MDPQQQQQMANIMAGAGIAFFVISLLVYVLLVVLFWRIFSKAGMSGALSLIALFPGLGSLICLCILAFSRWRVAPIAPGYADALAYPPPSYPPANYPPAEPPSQL